VRHRLACEHTSAAYLRASLRHAVRRTVRLNAEDPKQLSLIGAPFVVWRLVYIQAGGARLLAIEVFYGEAQPPAFQIHCWCVALAAHRLRRHHTVCKDRVAVRERPPQHQSCFNRDSFKGRASSNELTDLYIISDNGNCSWLGDFDINNGDGCRRRRYLPVRSMRTKRTTRESP
jgi:hypothetical protein